MVFALAGCGFSVDHSDDLGVADAGKSIGDPCTRNDPCECVDGYCCDQPEAMCGGCKACNLAGMEGHCQNVPAGDDPHHSCDGVPCADHCDGAGACRPAPRTTVCAGTSTCANQKTLPGQYGKAILMGRLCDGITVDVCPASSSAACEGSLVCSSNLTQCLSTCTLDADCVLGAYCEGGQCLGQKVFGASCARDFECQHSVCVNQMCVQCRTTADCAGTGRELCDPASHNCIDCISGPDCAADGRGNTCGGASPPHCGCTDSSQCTVSNALFCMGAFQCTCGDTAALCSPSKRCSDNSATGTCKVRTGFPCTAASDCFSGVCTAGVCG